MSLKNFHRMSTVVDAFRGGIDLTILGTEVAKLTSSGSPLIGIAVTELFYACVIVIFLVKISCDNGGKSLMDWIPLTRMVTVLASLVGGILLLSHEVDPASSSVPKTWSVGIYCIACSVLLSRVVATAEVESDNDLKRALTTSSTAYCTPLPASA